ncbi:MAG: hypothetical protein ACLPGW_11815 [Roseiarcus sp.]
MKGAGFETTDEVVAHDAEIDRAGSIPAALELFPKAWVVANTICRRMMCDAMPHDRGAFLKAKDREPLFLQYGDKMRIPDLDFAAGREPRRAGDAGQRSGKTSEVYASTRLTAWCAPEQAGAVPVAKVWRRGG